jgi:hypothetical protein
MLGYHNGLMVTTVAYPASCPECGSTLHQSRRRGLVERVLLRLIGVRPLRCHRCLKRYYCPPAFVFRAPSAEDSSKT